MMLNKHFVEWLMIVISMLMVNWGGEWSMLANECQWLVLVNADAYQFLLMIVHSIMMANDGTRYQRWFTHTIGSNE